MEALFSSSQAQVAKSQSTTGPTLEARSPKDCPHCCQGLSLEFCPVEREVDYGAEIASHLLFS